MWQKYEKEIYQFLAFFRFFSYALARVGKTTPTGVRGVFATFRFKARDTARGKLSIRVTGAGLTNEKFEEIPGLKAQGATVTIIEPKSSQK